MTTNARPLVSIVIPSYNHVRYLERCLTSVFEQTYDTIEIIAIDDGSSDGSVPLLRRLARLSPVPITILEQNNRGAGHTINRAIALSTGNYINILNSDDAFSPDRIATLLSHLRDSESEFIFSGVQFIDDSEINVSEVDDYAIDLVKKQSEINDLMTVGFAAIKSNVAISTGNFLFSRQLYNRVGPFNNFKYCHDWDFLLRCLIQVEPIYLSQPLYLYRLHPQNSFRNLAEVAGHEGPTLMRHYFQSVRGRLVPNALAPCYQNWGEYFWSFIEEIDYWPYLNFKN
jgi:glycosyltransferase involved in cell wall biosynthesis